MSSIPRYIPHYTVDEYRQWEGDWELIDGVAIAMTPSPFGPHERVVSRLSFEIQTQLKSRGCSCEVYTNLDWIISQDTVIRPDLMVVCGEQPQRHLETPPALVAEVVSESTRGRDLTAKRTLCRECRVPHYLIIDPDERTIEHVSGESTYIAAADRMLELLLDATTNCSISIACGRLFD